MQTFATVDVVAPSGNWQVHVEPGSAVDQYFPFKRPVTVVAQSLTESTLTAAGIAAIVAEFGTYLTSAHLTSIFNAVGGAQTNGLGCSVNPAQVKVSVKATDASTVANAIAALLNTAANVT